MCGRFSLDSKDTDLAGFFEAESRAQDWVPRKWDEGERAEALSMLLAVSDEVAGTITTYEVDRKVNNSRTADPADASLIEPVG